jgi:hypothetical protein
VGVFFRREVVLRDEFGCDGGFGHEIKMLRLNSLPSSSVQMKCNAALAGL